MDNDLVFEEKDELSGRVYMAATAFFMAYFLAIFAMMMHIEAYMGISWAGLIVIGIAVPLMGLLIAKRGHEWSFQFIGYTLFMIGFGFTWTPLCIKYVFFSSDPVLVHYASFGIFAVAVSMAITGIFELLLPEVNVGIEYYTFLGITTMLLLEILDIYYGHAGIFLEFGWTKLLLCIFALVFMMHVLIVWKTSVLKKYSMQNALYSALEIFGKIDMITKRRKG